MAALDGFKLELEDVPGMARKYLVDPMLRNRYMRQYMKRLRELADKHEHDIPRLRLFKRMSHAEGKLDKPFIYDSQLLTRIEELEKRVYRRRAQKGAAK